MWRECTRDISDEMSHLYASPAQRSPAIATTHFHRTVYKGRATDGLASGRIQYITRTAGYAPVEARIRHQGLEAGSAQIREDLVFWNHRNLPSWSQNY